MLVDQRSLYSERESGECSENYENTFVIFVDYSSESSHPSQVSIESSNSTPISYMTKFTSAGTYLLDLVQSSAVSQFQIGMLLFETQLHGSRGQGERPSPTFQTRGESPLTFLQAGTLYAGILHSGPMLRLAANEMAISSSNLRCSHSFRTAAAAAYRHFRVSTDCFCCVRVLALTGM